MNDWQQDLEDKFKNITKEAANGDAANRAVYPIRRDSGRSDNGNSVRSTAPSSSNSIGSGSSDVLRRTVSQQVTTKVERRTNLMITREAALDDLEKLEKEATDEASRMLVKVAKVLVKVLATIRSNQLLTDEDKTRIKAARAEKKPEVK
jgi:hypothetical protein